jgi:hypothetical protein
MLKHGTRCSAIWGSRDEGRPVLQSRSRHGLANWRRCLSRPHPPSLAPKFPIPTPRAQEGEWEKGDLRWSSRNHEVGEMLLQAANMAAMGDVSGILQCR